MPKLVEIAVSPAQAADARAYTACAMQAAGIAHESEVAFVRVVRRSIDARHRKGDTGQVRVNMAVELWLDSAGEARPEPVHFEWGDVSGKTPVVVVGAGPAGLFAALELIELGYRPIVLERGKAVGERKRDVAAINRNEPVDPDSNYAFGEGGAGTYSDGKLYTRSKKRGDWRKALDILHFHGADEAILYESHPHIGTDRLPGLMQAMRETIVRAGGVMRFGARVTGLLCDSSRQKIKGVELLDGERVEGAAVVLATGHSARDIYELLDSQQIKLEAKPFAMGVRVEHRQEAIDRIQYKSGPEGRGEYLPAAAYSLVAQVPVPGAPQTRRRGVYSFCMCPGGFIVPALTQVGECVVNGMSPAGRNNPFANAGIVTQVLPEDYASLEPHFGPLAGMRLQQQLEKLGFAQGGGAQVAPAQRLDAFVAGRRCAEVLPSSYHPGVVASDMHAWLPGFIAQALRAGFKEFDKKMHGFITPGAQVIGIESRTSAPVRIPRYAAAGTEGSAVPYMHPGVEGLFPAGEGAGYAGGIVSAAVDGGAVARAVVQWLK